MAAVQFELINTAPETETKQVDQRFTDDCIRSKETRELVQNILNMNGAHISSDNDVSTLRSNAQEFVLASTMDDSANKLAPAKFEDARVTFRECRYRDVNLAPHPAFLSPDVHVLDRPSISSLMAMPIDETAHHTLIRDGIRPTFVDWQTSFKLPPRC